jgi:phage terminase large subunit-like protein
MLRIEEYEYKIPIKGVWHVIQEETLSEYVKIIGMTEKELDRYISEFQRNRFAFFMPHGRWRRYTEGNDGRAFINDIVADLNLLVCPNQVGKSCHGTAYIIARCIPCNPKWVCFKDNGLRFHKWTGPKEVIAASFSWDNVQTLWEEYQKWFPREELGPYAPNYGEFPGETGRPKLLTFGDGKPKSITLKCKTKITFLCYTQSQVHWEGKKCDMAHLDEQCPEDKFDGLSFRMATRGPFTPIIMTLTGHVIDGRPDTGAGGWIKKKLIDSPATKSRKMAQYKIGIKDVPDEIMSKEKKKALFIQFVEEPRMLNDEKGIRVGEARFNGGWEVGGGVVISAWNPDIHMIAPFDIWKFKPTLYRMIDHGENPCAMLLFAVMPWGDAVIFKEYYDFGHSPAKNCEQMVELCGNERLLAKDFTFEGQTWQIYDESPRKMDFYASEMDGRSFNSRSKESGRTIGQLYNDSGCRVTPASNMLGVRKDGTGLISMLCQWFEMDKQRKHIDWRLGRKYPSVCTKVGAPAMYAFNNLVNLKKEIEGWTINQKTGRPVDKDDHLVSCLKFFTGRERPYLGDYGVDEEQEVKSDMAVNKTTGY